MLLRSYFCVVLLRAISIVLAGAYVGVVTALVSPFEFGRFNLVLSVAQLLGAALLSWPNQALLRYGREDYRVSGSFGGVFGARLLLQILLLLIILPVVIALSPRLAGWLAVEVQPLAITLCLVLVLLPIADLSNVVAQIVSRFVGYGLSPIVQRLAQLGVLGLVFLGVPLSWDILMMGNVVGYLIATMLIGMMIPSGILGNLRFELRQVKRIFSYSWAMPLASLSAFLISWMDIWFLRHFSGLESVGIYAWAYNISLLATNLLVPVAAVLAPRSIDLRVSERRMELGRMLNLTFAIVALSAALMPAFLVCIGLVAQVLPLGAYSAAVPPLLILAAGTLFQLGMALMEPVVFAHEKLVVRAVLLMIGMAGVNALLNILLIPSLGLIGPAIATAAAYAFGMFMQWTLLERALAFPRSLKPGIALVWAAVPVTAILILNEGGRAAYVGLVVCSALMLLAGRRSGLFAGIDVLRSRLKPGFLPILNWLVFSKAIA